MRPPTHAEQEMPAPSDLVDKVLGLLEEAGVPTEINDKIVDLIEAWEWPHRQTAEQSGN